MPRRIVVPLIDIISGPLGWIHFISAVVALLFGTLILALRKGTRRHRTCGWIYVMAMLAANGTAFGLYNLFGHFGVFHMAAAVSLVTVVMGLIPAVRRRPKPMWIVYHLAWMYWSVIGLYAAFASELLTRVPETPFLGMVGVATGGIIAAGGVLFARFYPRWKRQFMRL